MQEACLKCSSLSGRMRLYSDALKGANEPEESLQGRGGGGDAFEDINISGNEAAHFHSSARAFYCDRRPES